MKNYVEEEIYLDLEGPLAEIGHYLLGENERLVSLGYLDLEIQVTSDWDDYSLVIHGYRPMNEKELAKAERARKAAKERERKKRLKVKEEELKLLAKLQEKYKDIDDSD